MSSNIENARVSDSMSNEHVNDSMNNEQLNNELNDEIINELNKWEPLTDFENVYEIETKEPHRIRRICDGFMPKISICKGTGYYQDMQRNGVLSSVFEQENVSIPSHSCQTLHPQP